MAETSEVVIVGGGIVGCATAYYLARAGLKPTLIEKGSVGSCASGFSAGLLNPLHGSGIPGPLEDLALSSFQLHATLAAEVKEHTGIDHQFRPAPSIYLAFDDAQSREAREVLGLADRAEGFVSRWLDGAEVLSMEPRIAPGVVGGAYVEGTIQVDSYQYTLALLQAAEKHGATIRHGTVQGLRSSNGKGVSGGAGRRRDLLRQRRPVHGAMVGRGGGLARPPGACLAPEGPDTAPEASRVSAALPVHGARGRVRISQARRHHLDRHHRGACGIRRPAYD